MEKEYSFSTVEGFEMFISRTTVFSGGFQYHPDGTWYEQTLFDDLIEAFAARHGVAFEEASALWDSLLGLAGRARND